jgi:hypothetical protein
MSFTVNAGRHGKRLLLVDAGAFLICNFIFKFVILYSGDIVGRACFDGSTQNLVGKLFVRYQARNRVKADVSNNSMLRATCFFPARRDQSGQEQTLPFYATPMIVP